MIQVSYVSYYCVISVCVFMHTCMHLIMHTCVHVYIHQYIHACMYVDTDVHTDTDAQKDCVTVDTQPKTAYSSPLILK